MIGEADSGWQLPSLGDGGARVARGRHGETERFTICGHVTSVAGDGQYVLWGDSGRTTGRGVADGGVGYHGDLVADSVGETGNGTGSRGGGTRMTAGCGGRAVPGEDSAVEDGRR